MTPVPRRARSLSAVVLLSTLLVASSRANPVPSDREVHERWRKRLPAQIERLRPAARERVEAAAAELRARLETLRALPPAERRRLGAGALASRRGAAGPAAATGPFHSGGAAVCEPLPTNPLLDPLAIFEDESGEEPPVGGLSRHFFADFDGDGDLDLFVGDKYGYVRYLENVGTAAEPEFVERTGAASPTGALDLSETEDDGTDEPFGPSAPALVDIDGDGDLDLFVGTGYDQYPAGTGGRVLFFENDGADNLVRDDTGNPLAGFVFGGGGATPHFVDIDGDGDFDAFVGTKILDGGSGDGEVFFLRNEGTATAPNFVDRTDDPLLDPFAGVDFLPLTAPYFADVDGDGDDDAFVGNGLFTRFFRNTGGVFGEETGFDNPLAGSLALAPAPALVDVDADGDLDAFLGGGADLLGNAFFFENGGDATSPAFLSTAAHVELFDVDGDGDLDALAGLKLVDFVGTAIEPSQGVALFENTGTTEEPRWELQSGADNPFAAFNVDFAGSDAAPTVGDLDGDGLLEAFVGAYDGSLEYHELSPVSGLFLRAAHPLDAYSFGYSTDPHLADLDGDGELDLLVGYSYYVEEETYEARVAVFLNPPGPDGLDTVPDFVVDLAATGGETAQPTLADVDGDGDLDMLVGLGYGPYSPLIGYANATFLVENTGDATNPVFDGATAELLQVAQGGVASPAAGDLNGDGLLDLVLGSVTGAEVFLTAAAGVTVEPATLTTTEAGGGDTFTVVLDTAPSGSVIFDVTTSDPGEGTAAPAQLVFDADTWDLPQTVTVTGVDDPDPDGPQPYDVVLSLNPASTAGPCIAQPTVAAVNLDDEVALLAVTKEITGGDLRAGGTVVYTLTLENQGAAVQPDDPDEAELTDTLPAELTLTSATLTGGPGAVTTSGATVRFDGELAPGETATIVIEAAIASGIDGQEIANQATAFSDNDSDGDNESPLPSDDPTTPEPGDATIFVAAAAPGPPITEIPTLSQWGAGLFAGLLSLLGLYGLRRRP